MRAENIYGPSEDSLELIVGLGNKPPAPSNLRVELLSSKYDSFLVKWDEITESDLPILGYVLLIDDGLQGDFTVAYDGSFNPQMTEFMVSELASGRTYRLKAYATDINGPGVETPILTQIACIGPEVMALPVLDAVTKTTFTLSW